MAIKLQDLNPPQRQAVTTLEGPLLVLAGAGSGKTRVITHRIGYLIERGTRPESICAVSFTNKAAEEMRERVERLCGSQRARGVTLSTFHALGLIILKAESQALGLTGGFTVYDTADQLGVLREILRSAHVGGKRIDLKAVLSRISRLKNAGVDAKTFVEKLQRARAVSEYDGYAAEVYPRYQARMRALAAFDFDDLLVETLRLLREDESVRSRWQLRFRYLMIDEYQDTNRCQLELLRVLSAGHGNLAVVGDDDQSIYAWRGAESRNILEFASHFPGATVIKLEENYRSTDVILSAANAVIAKNTSRHGKTLWTRKKGGEPIEVLACPDEQAEATFVAEEIDRLVAQVGFSLRDIAVLYRSNAQTAALEEGLRQARIDYRVVGGQAFYDRKEVKDAIAYLKLLVFPHDELALRRVINYPPRGIGPGALERLSSVLRQAHKKRPNLSLWDLLCAVVREKQTDLFSAAAAPRDAGETDDLPHKDESVGPRVLAALSRFVDAVQRHRGALERPPAELYQGLDTYLREMGVHDDLVRSGPSRIQAERRLRNLGDFLHGIERHAERPGFDLHAHLQRMALSAQDEDADDGLRDEVTLSTLHGSKGLEFRAVFLCGFEEELLPHRRSVDPRPIDDTLAGEDDFPQALPGEPGGSSQIDEERRLCYVGITRARERLYLLFTRERTGRMALRSPSRFLEDIPKELLRLRDLEVGGPPITDKASEERFAMESLSKLLELTGEGS